MRTEYCKNLPSDDWDYKYEGESQKAPYSIIVELNCWAGNIERELIGYSMGILDEVQMNVVGHSEKERAMFWEEVFNRKAPIEYEDEYILKDKYLCERWEDVDDWMQATFYNIEYKPKSVSKETDSCLKIYLFEPIKPEWFEQLIINRMYDFFDKKIYKYLKDEDKITALYLVDQEGKIIKHYTYADVEINQKDLLNFYNAEERTMTRAAEKDQQFLDALDTNLKELTEILKELNDILREDKERK